MTAKQQILSHPEVLGAVLNRCTIYVCDETSSIFWYQPGKPDFTWLPWYGSLLCMGLCEEHVPLADLSNNDRRLKKIARQINGTASSPQPSHDDGLGDQ